MTAITTVAESGSAIVVRIDAPDFTDYAAVAFQTDKKLPQVLAAADNPNQVFAFCDYGYLRLPRQGNAVARQRQTRVPGTAASLLLNGREITSTAPGHYLIYGELPEKLAPATRPDPECPLRLQTVPAVARLSKSRTNELVLAATNTLDKPVGGRLEFDLPPGVTIRPEQPSFGPVAPGQTAQAPADAGSRQRRCGRQTYGPRPRLLPRVRPRCRDSYPVRVHPAVGGHGPRARRLPAQKRILGHRHPRVFGPGRHGQLMPCPPGRPGWHRAAQRHAAVHVPRRTGQAGGLEEGSAIDSSVDSRSVALTRTTSCSSRRIASSHRGGGDGSSCD